MKNLLIALCTTFVTAGLLLLETSTNSGHHDHYPRFLSRQVLDDELRSSLFPVGHIDLVGFIAIIIALMLAASGGIGGGGLLVPIFVLILRFPVKQAVGLSNVAVFGGAMANTAVNSSKRHPMANRPLVDWDVLSMMEPLTMAGALVGAELNQVLPEVLVVVMLVLLLGFTTARTLQKANEMHAVESACRVESSEFVALVSQTNYTSHSYGSRDIELSSKEEAISELSKLLEEESKAPWTRILQLSALFLLVICLNLLKGGRSLLQWLPFEVPCGSIVSFALDIMNVSIILLFAKQVRGTLIDETSRKLTLSYRFVEGDVIWDETNTWKYSCICSFAGLFAGLFGIGGGIVKSPLLLEMGVHPAVASATSSTMILFTSFTAMTTYMVYGELKLKDATVCVVVGFICTLVGQVMMQALVAKYHRHSYIAYSIALVVGISAAAMTVESIMAMSHGKNQHGAGLCPLAH